MLRSSLYLSCASRGTADLRQRPQPSSRQNAGPPGESQSRSSRVPLVVGGRAVERPARALAQRHGAAAGHRVGRRPAASVGRLNRRVARPSVEECRLACAPRHDRSIRQRGRADGTAARARAQSGCRSARSVRFGVASPSLASNMCTSGIASVNASCSPCDVVSTCARCEAGSNAWRARSLAARAYRQPERAVQLGIRAARGVEEVDVEGEGVRERPRFAEISRERYARKI